MRLRHLILSLLLALPLLAWAADGTATITADAPYVRQPPPSARAAGAFMTLRNTGQTALRLVAASTPAAGTAELHTHHEEDGMMKMRRVEAIDIPAGGEAVLRPGGLHVMLIDLHAPLAEGDSVPLTLHFDGGASLRVDAPVRRQIPTADHAPRH
ncbi:copper chaperone PCu(A)C [Pseudothauera nasutitermitis]|uniref:Copper chaperone PCu(A)C n=1 Tax=Pseudothauera nasutitermitis TaxID=2565930 RepID=A0A4S4B8K3_9RHOO|nr:copper chaperone PCu(A)C [Pseudothauera nasutitermitis]THF67333.1 copper chaperone PCu(A)C [Pseudothauera nasutitermitis]